VEADVRGVDESTVFMYGGGMTYIIGGIVKVNMPDGWLTGKVTAIYSHYGFNRELKYEVHGIKIPFVTIVSERNMISEVK